MLTLSIAESINGFVYVFRDLYLGLCLSVKFSWCTDYASEVVANTTLVYESMSIIQYTDM